MAQETKKGRKDYVAKAERAILELEAAGESPTVAAVQKITGGSYRDLAPAVRIAKEQIRLKVEQQIAVPDIPEELQAMVSEFWTAAFRVASEDFRKIIEVNKSETTLMQQSLLEREELLGKIEQEAEECRGQAATLDAKCQALEAEISALRVELQLAEARLAERESLIELLGVATMKNVAPPDATAQE